jgi:hypothetical protein
MSDIEELRKNIEKDVYERLTQQELKRRKQLLHESDKQIGEVVRRLKIKISRENLFMDDVTREELK